MKGYAIQVNDDNELLTVRDKLIELGERVTDHLDKSAWDKETKVDTLQIGEHGTWILWTKDWAELNYRVIPADDFLANSEQYILK